jgi:hypothetical protein
MKNQEINNQTTLFRFVSLRSAELTKKENQNKRFIFHPDNQTGAFFNAVLKKDTNTTKWDAMRTASENFSAFQNEKEIENMNSDYFKLADWISRNKSTLDPKELAEKIIGLDLLDPTFELNLWDNLFFQVLTQKSFYVKEAIIQLLVLNNILKNKSSFIGKEFDAVIAKQLLLAKVVIPVELFEENTISTNNNSTNQKAVEREKELAGFIPQEMLEAKDVAEAKNSAQNVEFLLSELRNIEQSHYETYQKEYNSELKAYQEKIKPTLVEYQKKYKEEQRRLCEKPKDENYNPDDICNQPNVEYPEIPEFVFNFSQEPEIKSLQEHLSKDSFLELSNQVDLKRVKSFTELKQTLENNLKVDHQKIVEKTKVSEQVLAFGDTAISIKGNTIQSNDFTFQICTTWLANGYVSPYMVIQLPNSSYTIQQFIYHLHYDNGGNNTNGYFNQSLNGNVLTLSNMYNNILPLSVNENVQGISGYIVFTNGQTYTFDVEGFSLQPICFRGKLVIKGGTDTSGNNKSDDNSFIPNAFGYRQLGIADYKKVVSKICKYEVGEVAHIENVMARELREKSTTKFHQTQVIETESNEIETEKVNDTTTTERFEMQTEVAKLMQEQKQFSAQVNVNSSWGNTTIDAGASYASNVSKEESNRQAVNQAKEITQRAMERIVSRVKNEKTVKTTDEFTEVNTHVFDNTESGEHVSGVFRFINAIYKNQIYNYGKRLMYEFMIPEPSKLHRLGMEVSKSGSKTTAIDKPIDPRTAGYADFTSINESNYQLLASKYNADVEICPETFINLSQSFLKEDWSNDGRLHKSGEFAIKIPEKYAVDTVKGFFDPMNGAHSATWNNMGGVIYIGTKRIGIPSKTSEMPIFASNFDTEIKNEVKITMTTWDIATYNFNLIIKCKLTEGAKVEWRKKTFEAILKGYFNQLAEYNQSIAEAKATGIQILDSNPLFYRQIEQNVLRQNCISYLLDHSTNANNYKQFGLSMYDTNAIFTNFQVNLDKKMDDYGSFAKFMEQAFEWNLISYNFYPYYWANKDEWKDLYQFESNDAIFRSFMQSGMARVIVTVKPGFEDAVMHYMAFGQIWNGGQMPVLGNPLYLSIVDELKEQEYTVEETWTTTLPTNLIALQKSGVAVDASGLPTLDTCETQAVKKLVANEAKLGIGTAEGDTKLADRVTKLESRMIENIDINDGKISLTTKGKNRQVVAQITTEDLKRELK